MTGATFAPGVREALEAQMGVDASTTVVKADGPRFIGGAARSTVMPLAWPVEYDGIVYESVVLRRLTTTEVAAFLATIEHQADDAKITFPVFRRADDDAEIPEAVLGALDDDDMATLNEAAIAFLPRRFRGDPASASIPSTGAPTAP